MSGFFREIRQFSVGRSLAIQFNCHAMGAILVDLICIFTILTPTNFFKSIEPAEI